MRVAKNRRLKRKARLARKAALEEGRQERIDRAREEWCAVFTELAAQRLPDPHADDY